MIEIIRLENRGRERNQWSSSTVLSFLLLLLLSFLLSLLLLLLLLLSFLLSLLLLLLLSFLKSFLLLLLSAVTRRRPSRLRALASVTANENSQVSMHKDSQSHT